MQYSVSPRLTFRILGPKPSENVRTRDAVPARRKKMPQLVDEDQDAENEQERQ